MDAPSPGSLLREAIALSETTPNALALSMGVTSSCVWYLLHDKRGITAKMAVKLANAMPKGPSASEWLGIQAAWDLGKVGVEKQEAVS